MNNYPIPNIILTSWNALEFTQFTIDSLRKYTTVPYYLTVVDNGSGSEVINYLKSIKADGYLKDVKLILNKKNLGPGKAFSQGIDARDSDYFCLINNDIALSENWLQKLFANIQTDDKIGLLGTLRPATFVKHPFTNKSAKEVVQSLETENLTPAEELNAFCMGISYDEFVNKIIEVNDTGLIVYNDLPFHVVTCCVIGRNSIIQEIGGIADPIFTTYGSEDTDVSWRLVSNGYKFAVATDVYIHHFKHKSLKANKVNRDLVLKVSNSKFFLKWEKVIKDFLLRMDVERGNIADIMENKEYEDFWFLRRLNEDIKFWVDNDWNPQSHQIAVDYLENIKL